MKNLKDIFLKNCSESEHNLKVLCDSIEQWVIEEFAPAVQDWVIKEFSHEIENWVKEYLNNKQTPLHISDFCADDSNDGKKPIRKKPISRMGTVEPHYNDAKVSLSDTDYLCDQALAFIYGAIKKYGTSKLCLGELKDYIFKETKYIGGKEETE